MTRRKPATTGEIPVEEFMKPIGLTQGALAEAMGVQRKHVNELCNDEPICGKRCIPRENANGSNVRVL